MSETDPIVNTEMRNEKSNHLHQFSTMDIIKLMNEEDDKVAGAVKHALPQIERVIDRAVEVMEKGGRLFYFGAGTSGRLGVLDASECPPTFGVSHDLVNGVIAGGDEALRYPIENAEDSKETGAADVRKHVSAEDMVIGIASSGRTPYVLGAMEAAFELEVSTGCVCCNVGTELAEMVGYPIEVPVGAEVVTGSTRLKAGTAQKMVLNMISTATMIKLGKVYRNLMVNVQASNEKLRKRAISIIQELTGVDETKAAYYSRQANGDARIATLMILLEIDANAAQSLLDQKNGHFPNAVEGFEVADGKRE
ncbi:N-acetylmuramic acid 6-phosphate etherase [Pontibacillus yanchengensis]|uniref:N-acetylmuramic acid 6-phosphate etherase n=1 Tax=Pontibacillus yanchengensis TaxID=462910 RepID=A0A6I4ZYE6_9BACI|nr:N-acetylmuramic acid 6-phosphate etherase [Pontibacillus yanchengensis]MYL33916.1 N-acetylmuramic acid 6-phosphate etherase [Pontibacillus yanchengensis]